VVADPKLSLVYSDEDKLDADGRRFDPNFKPDWNPDLLRSQNYICHLTAIRTALARDVGGFRQGFEGSQDHDLILRCSEQIDARQIGHIPEILYHWRAIEGSAAAGRGAKGYAAAAGARAVAEHLARTQTAATVVNADRPPGLYRVRWPLPKPVPKISLVIPTRDRVDLLETCVESILAKSTYPDFELVVVDNQSRDTETMDYLRALRTRERVRVLGFDAPFNYSAINNWAARQCDGALLALVNNDIEVITPDWLEQMAGFAVRPDIGAVGAMLYYPDDTIQHAGVILGILGVAGHIDCGMPRGYEGHGRRALVAQNLSAVTGACLMVRRQVFDEVAGLDEQLPVSFNDIDFCLRVRTRGYRNVWTPFAELYHHESASRGRENTAEKLSRYAAEVAFMQERWGVALREDPAYNPNLSLQSHNFRLAFPPRRRGWDDQ
ncbi:MAG: glycosyltransferase family 2 protein, partial [Rhodanobacteraceae bacterium]